MTTTETSRRREIKLPGQHILRLFLFSWGLLSSGFLRMYQERTHSRDRPSWSVFSSLESTGDTTALSFRTWNSCILLFVFENRIAFSRHHRLASACLLIFLRLRGHARWVIKQSWETSTLFIESPFERRCSSCCAWTVCQKTLKTRHDGLSSIFKPRSWWPKKRRLVV